MLENKEDVLYVYILTLEQVICEKEMKRANHKTNIRCIDLHCPVCRAQLLANLCSWRHKPLRTDHKCLVFASFFEQYVMFITYMSSYVFE